MTAASELRANADELAEKIAELRDVVGTARYAVQAEIRALLDERNRLLGVRACTLEVAS
jgi:hypothetical protein